MIKRKRFKSKKYLQAVAQLPCVLTGMPAQVHHCIGHGVSGMGLKAGDDLTFPLSPEMHDKLHRYGYKAWENEHGSQQAWAKRTQYVLELLLIEEYEKFYGAYYEKEHKEVY